MIFLAFTFCHTGLHLLCKMKRKFFILITGIFFFKNIPAQPATALYVRDALKTNRAKLYQNLVHNAISKNLSYPLADSTEENWTDAFWAMELIHYKSPWADNCVRTAFDSIEKRGSAFQRVLMELLYANYPLVFSKEAEGLLNITGNDKIFAMCAEYLSMANPSLKNNISALARQRFEKDSGNVFLQQVVFRLSLTGSKIISPDIKKLLQHPFFNGAKVVFSFQRKNRDYPGLVIIRDSAGSFIKDDEGNIFSVTQLARSITNLPGYLTNGNTPQGIFRMDGFDVSKSNFIGPTPNIQLTLPFETSIAQFMNDSTITDSAWTMDWYKKLLPDSWKNYLPIYGTWYAGKAGRTEIIAHGTTINPDYYRGQPYYPLTPTLGCLCTKEIWSEEDGRRKESDQQKLVDALLHAGGANGYYIVIELNDEQRPVTINDVQSSLK